MSDAASQAVTELLASDTAAPVTESLITGKWVSATIVLVHDKYVVGKPTRIRIKAVLEDEDEEEKPVRDIESFLE